MSPDTIVSYMVEEISEDEQGWITFEVVDEGDINFGDLWALFDQYPTYDGYEITISDSIENTTNQLDMFE